MHVKAAVIDGAWPAVGSGNLAWRSAVWNTEIDAIVLAHFLGGQMEAMFQADLAASTAIDLPHWRQRGLGARLREWKAGLLEKLL